jgi:aminopeptidase YwaD
MNRSKWFYTPLVAALLLTLSISLAWAQSPDPEIGAKQLTTQINGQRTWQFTRYLASDALQGRLAGTEGEQLAAEYIGKKFQEWGLEPAGDGGTYFQNFTVSSWYATAPVNLALEGAPSYEFGADYTIFTYSGSTDTTAEVVFAGYGMSIPTYNPADYPGCPAPVTGYDDYAGVDVTDKIVLVLRHGPQQDDNWYYYCPNIVSPGYSVGGLWWFGYKAYNAYLHGAKGMILVSEYKHGHTPEPGLGTLYDFHYAADMGSVFAHRSIGELLVPDLAARQDSIDSTLTPASWPTGQSMNMVVTAVFDADAPSQNVLGAIPGTDPEIGDEVVIVSAHYDHEGVAPMGEVYPGADDDASGTAVMMEIAKVLSSGNFAPERTILFAAWGSEEAGLVGSYYYVEDDPKYPLEDTLAVLQMDMVGVGNRTGLNVFGGTVFTDLFSQIQANADEVNVEAMPFAPGGGSDHVPFVNAGVPAVMFQTMGPHDYYHTPADTIDTIDRYELEHTGRVVGATAYEFAMDETFDVTRPTGFLDRHTHGRDSD